MTFLHLYENQAVFYDGESYTRIHLTDEQIVRIAAQATKLASVILEKRDVRAASPGDVAGRILPTHAGG